MAGGAPGAAADGGAGAGGPHCGAALDHTPPAAAVALPPGRLPQPPPRVRSYVMCMQLTSPWFRHSA